MLIPRCWIGVLLASSMACPAPAQSIETAALRITVLDPDGKPMRGALVQVLRFEGADACYSNLDIGERHEHRVVTRMPTPKSGSLGLQLPTAIPFRVCVDIAPHAIEWRAGIYAGEELTIRLRPGAVVEGVVRDDSGRTIPAENVVLLTKKFPRAARFTTTAGADGKFRFERMMPGEVSVDAESSQGAVHGGQTVTLESGRTKQVEFELDRGATMRGRVVDASTGEPIAGARLGVGWTFDKPVLTDEDGRYELIGLGGPFSNNLYLAREGYTELQIDRPEAKTGTVQLDLKMHRGFAIEGRIVDGDGEPVADCYVAAVGMTHGGMRQETDWLSTRTDENGRYTIADIRHRLQPVLLVRRDLHATLSLPIPAPGRLEKLVLDDVELRPRSVIHGVLLGADDKPVVGQKVVLKGNHTDAPAHTQKGPGGSILGSYLGDRDAYTDSLGRFFFGDVAAGSYTLKTDPFEREITVTEAGNAKPIELHK